VLFTLIVAAFPRGLPVTPAMANSFPAVRSLALPRATFPRHATVRGAPAGAPRAEGVTGLHTVSLQTLGRVAGYLQVASWWVGRQYVTLSYSASVFGSSDGAVAARADAIASLVEIGRPVRVPGMILPVFGVWERDGHLDVVAVRRQGAVEIEIVLRLQRGAPLSTGAGAFRGAVGRAATISAHYAAALPSAPPGPSTPSASPALYVAPNGTGPVVKSPSLMALDQTTMSPAATLDPGVFRTQAPPLARRARLHLALLPPGSLSRYVRTGVVNGRVLYNATALYPSTAAAITSFNSLQSANDRKSWLGTIDTSSDTLPPDTDIAAWNGGGETMVLLRTQNVLMVLAGGPGFQVLAPLVHPLLASVPTWLHAQGTQTVDSSGVPIRLAGLNWYGAESPDYVVGGLDYQPYQSILEMIQRSGYNTIRLPFSNQLVEANPVITDHLGANRELIGLHALDILDRIVAYAGALGLHVILDDHRSEAGWSSQPGGLWYTDAYPDSAFQADWVTMTERYAASNVVIGADLRNEPHGTATWGGPDPTTDWHAAAERTGNAILAVNPHLLIIVEGVQTYGAAGSYWWGGNLMGVASDPVVLQFPDDSSARSQLVYSAHDYGPDNCGSGCPWFNSTTTYASLAALWEEHWGYITADPSQPYAAPVWVGEFGTCNFSPTCGSDTTPGSQGQWFSSLIQYLGEKQLGWAYWSVNGSQSSGTTREYGILEGYGLLNPDWTTQYPWLAQELSTIQTLPSP
jgi:aryl-phospho-beta-D-glucosidase BglC (GH1 family)